MTQQQFGWKYSKKERELMETFCIRCVTGKLETFTADTFRMFGLTQFLEDPQHQVGTLFAKMVHNGDAIKVGWTPSTLPANNMRSIRVYEWNTQK